MAARIDPEKASPGTRDKILEAAERLISLHGTEGFQLKDVADAVGIRPPSVYAHFDGKDAISREVAFRLYRGIYLEVDPSDLETGDPAELMRNLIHRIVRYFEKHPGHLRLVLRDIAHSAFAAEQTEPPTLETWTKTTSIFQRIVERGIESGQFRSIRSAAALSQIVGAILVNLCWFGWDDQGHPKSGVTVSDVVVESQEMALRLLRAEPGSTG
jgi:AcrR family transcriptional regulator